MCPTLERVVKARVLCALCRETIWRVESHRRLLDVKRKKRILYAKVLEWNGEGKTHLAAITRPRNIRKMGVLLFPTFCAFITFFEGKK